MTNDHLRQRLPNRRFRRLFPAAVAAVTIAASAPFAASAHAAPAPSAPKAAHVQSPGQDPHAAEGQHDARGSAPRPERELVAPRLQRRRTVGWRRTPRGRAVSAERR